MATAAGEATRCGGRGGTCCAPGNISPTPPTGASTAAFQADWWDELECAWTLKEMLRDVYASPDRHTAEAALADWHTCAGAYDIAETNRLARTLRAWEAELLAYFDERLTNGPTEGTNRIIKAVKRQGFGYTNPQNYRWRVLYRVLGLTWCRWLWLVSAGMGGFSTER